MAKEIKLQRFGGIIPKMQEAVTQVDWSDHEIEQLLSQICRDEDRDSGSMDTTCHYLKVDGREVPVDLKKVPPKYKNTFEDLKADLKYVKS